ncbi:TPA: type III secretion system protein [Yersinia enterocolitica]|uniref:type III secretion system protein n=1 Tax=Yersinia enterocolitica TaxID=630 RepID=UPI0005E619D5|nr:type III secretion system protein [Yersinia enterocolitica]ELI8171263.1 type III secretion system protein [Yersinia enterocolitica]ELW7389546.1 type III secretion system protein [Yersinia enterocolitica]ELZ1906971.1 type III secretion system protein [Yersinia enterocolitica]EMA7649005.1 type III secretion system protein [Yersinia enterocolitica]CFB69774.1 type III secretion system protein SsaM [Yersinia enterocolitica]
MEMDLVVTRNLQLFTQMAELPCSKLSSRMEWQIEQRLVFLEWRNERLLLTSGVQHRRYHFEDLLLLQRSWQLERFNGVPQRIYLLKMGMMVSCSPPVSSGAECWFQLYQQQCALLRRLPGEYR